MPRGAKSTKPSTISKIIACNEYAKDWIEAIITANDIENEVIL